MKQKYIINEKWYAVKGILSGRKKIKLYWHKNRLLFWNIVRPKSTIYIKDNGSPITVEVEVDKVMHFNNLTPIKIQKILEQYGQINGLGIDDLPRYFNAHKTKKYCTLIFLKNPKQIDNFYNEKQLCNLSIN